MAQIAIKTACNDVLKMTVISYTVDIRITGGQEDEQKNSIDYRIVWGLVAAL